MSIINIAIANMLPFVPKPVVGYFAKRYIAGDKLEDATRVISELNNEGFMCTVNILGENIKKIESAVNYLQRYKEILNQLTEKKLDSNISIKMTQMGMGLDDEVCLKQMDEIIQLSKQENNFVRIDMEESIYTSKTLEIHSKLAKKHNNVGIVIQAYLRRSESDVSELIKIEAGVRLCKGIYVEPREIAFKDRENIRQNYTRLLKMLLKGGRYVGIATHDERLVYEAYDIINEMGLGKEEYEFQMIYGVNKEMGKRILADGHRLRIYVPYGEEWHAYSIRRLKENPDIAGHIIKNILSFNNRGS
ncbi:MAG: proline dehydrogenase family protein [Candidatus Marinimicrobia bacterium]|nr:proline dehydrogenase family protein [Candidatus Neomarinimicrobiota bacterium]